MSSGEDMVRKIPHFRWWICLLLSLATALSFFDRQVLSILAPEIIHNLRLNDVTYSRAIFAFILSYTIMFTVGGRLIDWLGLRVGLGLSVAVWTVGSLCHSLVRTGTELGLSRFLLGVGEGGCFPGATKGAIEWFPEKERSVAIGLAIGGSSFGAVIAPPLIVWVNSLVGWRGAFLVTGAIGFIWVIAWLLFFKLPRQSPYVSSEELQYITRSHQDNSNEEPGKESQPEAHLVALKDLLRKKEIWGLIAARFMLDPVFYFYMFWIPQYLSEVRHVSMTTIGELTWIPFLSLGVSQVAGGWLSDRLVKRGMSINLARKSIMGVAAFVTPLSILSILARSAGMAICLMSILMFAHGFWITNYITMTGDLFPERTVATVVGLCGSAGGLGGILSSLAVGVLAQQGLYNIILIACGVMYPMAFIVILLTIRKVQPLGFKFEPAH